MASSENSGGRGGAGRRGRRYHQNLQGVLQLCVDAQTNDGATASGETGSDEGVQVMSEQRRSFLQGALREAFVNIVEVEKSLLTVLTDPDSISGEDDKCKALESLTEVCEHIDAACDFHKIGGFPILKTLLNHSEAEIRWRTADFLAGLSQNNPYCQQALVNSEFMPVLMKLLDEDPMSLVRVKALYALSCLCREFEPAQEEFCRRDGFSYLMRAMQGTEEKLQIKSAFMLTSLCSVQPKFKDILCNMGMVQQLIGLLNREHCAFHEHLMGCLVSIVKDHTRSVESCRQSELQMKELLENRIKDIDGKEEFLEEKEFAEQLMTLCFVRPDSAKSTLER